jgi:protein XagA
VLKRCAGFILGLVVAPTAAWAAAWTLPQGAGQVFTTFTASSATNSFDGSGLTPTQRYNKDELAVLLEYGLTDKFTAILDPGLQHVDIAGPNGGDRTGLGYTEFGGRYQLLSNQSWVLSGQATLRVPGTVDTPNPAAVGYTDVEADFRALLGHSFVIGTMPAFTDLQVAERARTAGAPSEFRVDGTFGLQMLPRWLLLAQSFNVISEGAGSTIYGGSYGYYKAQLSAVYSLTPTWSVQAGAYSTYAGHNALQENGLIFSVWHQF